MQKAVIIGASSGIGRAIAHVLATNGYTLGLVARRYELLVSLQKELQTKTYIKQLDVTQVAEARQQVSCLMDEMGGVDLFIVNAGIIFNNRTFEWDKEKRTIEVNAMGFAAMAHVAMTYFFQQGKGHLVGISSISAIRGESESPAYSASKAFVSNYLEGLRKRAFKEKKEIFITDIQPGWIDTVMAKGEQTFWMATPEEAAKYIYAAVHHKKKHAYITPRWRFYAWLLKLAPRWFYDRYI